LSLVLPREAVRTAFRALHTDDKRLRALAVEYLGSSLPRAIRDRLCERIDTPAAAQGLRRLPDSSSDVLTPASPREEKSQGTAGS